MFPELNQKEIKIIADVINNVLEENNITLQDFNAGRQGANVMIVAGEASGDLHGANLVREMLKIKPDLNFYGIGAAG